MSAARKRTTCVAWGSNRKPVERALDYAHQLCDQEREERALVPRGTYEGPKAFRDWDTRSRSNISAPKSRAAVCKSRWATRRGIVIKSDATSPFSGATRPRIRLMRAKLNGDTERRACGAGRGIGIARAGTLTNHRHRFRGPTGTRRVREQDKSIARSSCRGNDVPYMGWTEARSYRRGVGRAIASKRVTLIRAADEAAEISARSSATM